MKRLMLSRGQSTLLEVKQRGPRPTRVVFGTVVSLALLCGSAGVASASWFSPPGRFGAPHGGGAAAAGTVASAPSDNAFTITTRSGSTLTIDVSGSTTYVERGVSSPSLANVTQGELVAVFGTTSGTTVTATKVVIALPRRTCRYVTVGKVATAPSGNSFTITTWNGTTVTVDVTTSTTYEQNGVASSLSAVTPGVEVAVFGTASGTTVAATEVVIAAPKPTGSFVTAGTVATAPSGNSFTITTWNGTTDTVNVSGTTLYSEYGVASASLTNVTQGSFVAIYGTASGTTVTATEVVIAGNQHQGLFGFGSRFHFGHGGFRRFGGFGFGRGGF